MMSKTWSQQRLINTLLSILLTPPVPLTPLSLLLLWENLGLLTPLVKTFSVKDLSLLPSSLDLSHLRPRLLPSFLNFYGRWWYGIAAIESALYQHQGYTCPQLKRSVGKTRQMWNIRQAKHKHTGQAWEHQASIGIPDQREKTGQVKHENTG